MSTRSKPSKRKMSVDLYGIPSSAPCRSIMMAAKALGVTLNLKTIDPMTGDTRTPAYSKMNIQHTIPTMDDNGFFMNESRAIIQYLADKYGKDDKLYPKDLQTRAKVNMKLFFDIGTLYTRFMDAYFPAIFEGKPFDEERLDKLNEALGYVEEYVKDGYIAGKNLTIADFAVAATLSTIEAVGHNLSDFSKVAQYLEKLKGEIEDYQELNQLGADQFGKLVTPNLDQSVDNEDIEADNDDLLFLPPSPSATVFIPTSKPASLVNPVEDNKLDLINKSKSENRKTKQEIDDNSDADSIASNTQEPGNDSTLSLPHGNNNSDFDDDELQLPPSPSATVFIPKNKPASLVQEKEPSNVNKSKSGKKTKLEIDYNSDAVSVISNAEEASNDSDSSHGGKNVAPTTKSTPSKDTQLRVKKEMKKSPSIVNGDSSGDETVFQSQPTPTKKTPSTVTKDKIVKNKYPLDESGSGADENKKESDSIPKTQVQKDKPKTTQIVDNEKPSTSKKLVAELSRAQRREKRNATAFVKTSSQDRAALLEEAKAMRGVLDSSDDDDDGDVKTKTRSRKSKSPMVNGVDTDDDDDEKPTNDKKSPVDADEDDPKLAQNDAFVRLIKIAPEIEDELKKEGYIISKSNDDGIDDDSDVDSESSISELDKAIKKLENYNALITKRSRKLSPTKEERKSKSKKTKKRANDKDTDDSLSPDDADVSGSGSEDDDENEKPIIVIRKITDITEVNSDYSELEDLPEDEMHTKGKSTKDTQRKSEDRGNSSSQKNYQKITISSGSDDSEKDDRRDFLGKDEDEDSDKATRKKKRSKNCDDSDSTDFEPLTIKRGKQKKTKKNTVLSDSDEAGSKDSSKPSSDSDDSDFVSKKPQRKGKRGHSSSEEDKKKKKKKRKRIKEARDSDDSAANKSSDSDIEEVAVVSGSQGRKQIRNIMSNKDLKKTTREAEKDEEERKKRVSEKQKLFNGIFDNASMMEGGLVKRVVLDVDSETKEPLIEVDETVVPKLKPHQVEGIKFMYTTCFESIEMIKQGKSGGCILAHCMGLGKTLQTVAFTQAVMAHKELTGVKRALVVCPLNTVGNWFKEYQYWLGDVETEKKPRLHDLWQYKTISQRVDALKVWERKGGVGIMHYEFFRLLVNAVMGKGKTKVRQEYKDHIRRILLDPGPEMIICDEGHLLKNHRSKLTEALAQIKTKRRVVLTGTPLQNNLTEYHTMVHFVKPNLLGNLKEFTNRFVNPIKNGQCKDSSDRDVKIMKRRAHVLHSKLDGCVQRLDYSVLTPYLPPKYEYCIIIKLSDKQKALYRDYIATQVSTDTISRSREILQHYSVLVKILAHPVVLSVKKSTEMSETDEEGSLKDFIDDGSGSERVEDTPTSDSDIELLDGESCKKPKPKRNTRSCPADPDEGSSNGSAAKESIGKEWWCSHFEKKEDMYDTNLSGKLIVLQEILKICETIGDKVLIFSQYLTTLNIIEEFLAEWDAAAQEENKDKPKTFPETVSTSAGRWRNNIEYFRIDGSTKTNDRLKHCDTFNKKSASKAKLFLISTRAGGLGINLFGANRVVIFDASWNPSNDMQSIFRVYRFGQVKPCYIYRFVAQATMEEKIYNRQVVKLSLSSRVIDEHQVERHFKFDDINEMYRFNPDEKTERPTPPLPKDRLLADLLISQKDWIDSYFEHDTLLVNKEEETLTEEERKQAWDEYQNENELRVNMGHAIPIPLGDQETFQKIKLKIQEKYPSAREDQIHATAVHILQRIHELRGLLQRLNLEGDRMPEVAHNQLDAKIKSLQTWITASMGSSNENQSNIPLQSMDSMPIPMTQYQGMPGLVNIVHPVQRNPPTTYQRQQYQTSGNQVQMAAQMQQIIAQQIHAQMQQNGRRHQIPGAYVPLSNIGSSLQNQNSGTAQNPLSLD